MTSRTAPWVGQILHVDLSTGAIEALPTTPYVASYLGGRGLAARLAWDLIPPGIGAFDPANPLMFFPGALVGTPAPSSGRVTVTGLSPQAYPHEWYTRANLGGHWGPMLKYAGYDGLIVTGQAAQPTVLVIEDGRTELRDASDLWGLGLVETQRRLVERLGGGWRVISIGPAGEHCCRYAVLATNTESAAGQGGFGAVMGSKNLKAIAVRGSGGVGVAQPREMLRRSRLAVEAIARRYGRSALPSAKEPDPQRRRPTPCTYQCPSGCGVFYEDAPGVIHKDRTYSGQQFCCSPGFSGRWTSGDMGDQVGFELTQICNDLGVNHWEILFGLIPWLMRLQQRGELLELEGDRFNLTDPAFWDMFLHRIAYRQGWGDVFAKGGPRAAAILGVGQDLIAEYYPAWGQASHWDGHGSFGGPYFPYWLVTSLQWAMDTRDPMGGGHGYTLNIFGPAAEMQERLDDAALERWRRYGEHLYGAAASVDPFSGYEGKAFPALFHQDRGAIKDSLGICDNIFPLLTDPTADDFVLRVDGVEGRDLEYYLFGAASDLPLSRDEFYRCGGRIYTAERMLAIRNWGRNRATDETLIPYLSFPARSVNPYIGQPVELDAARYRALMDEYYALRGWDVATAHPFPETLRSLGMTEYTSEIVTTNCTNEKGY